MDGNDHDNDEDREGMKRELHKSDVRLLGCILRKCVQSAFDAKVTQHSSPPP